MPERIEFGRTFTMIQIPRTFTWRLALVKIGDWFALWSENSYFSCTSSWCTWIMWPWSFMLVHGTWSCYMICVWLIFAGPCACNFRYKILSLRSYWCIFGGLNSNILHRPECLTKWYIYIMYYWWKLLYLDSSAGNLWKRIALRKH